MTKRIKKTRNEILKRNDFLVVPHINPDADAVSAAAFLVAYLSSKNKRVYAKYEGSISPRYEDHIAFLEEHAYKGETVSNVVFLDCTSPDRARMEVPDGAYVFNIDHHESNTAFGDQNEIHPESSSTCEILYDMFYGKGAGIDPFMKKCIITGILGDTGFLKYDNATSATFLAFSVLLKDMNIFEIYKKYYISMTLDHFKTFADLVRAMRNEGDIYYLVMRYETLRASHVTYDDISELLSWFRTLRDAEIFVFFREFEKDRVRINFRGNNDTDLNVLAGLFGGGGHRNAAAAYMEGDPEEIASKIIPMIKDHLKGHERDTPGR